MSKTNQNKNTNNPSENSSSSDSHCTPGSEAREIAMRAFYLGFYNIKYTVETSNEKPKNPLDSKDNNKPVLTTIKKPEEKQIPEKDKYLVETGKEEELWLQKEIKKRAREEDKYVDGNNVTRLKYLPEYYLKEMLEAKIKRFIDYAEALRKNPIDPKVLKASDIFIKYKELKGIQDEKQQTASKEELAKILEQAAIEHAMRLFLLTVPKKKTQEDNKNNKNTDTTNNSEDSQGSTKGKQKYYEFFKPSGVGDICDSALASYEKFKEWFKNQVFYNKKEAISKLPLKAYFNSYTNYIQATPTETYKLTSLPDDLILTAADFLTESEVAALSELNRYYFERFNNLRNVSELFRKPETKKELGIILENRFDVYQNLVSLDLRTVSLNNFEFTYALNTVQTFEKLKDLRLSIANAQQLTKLAKKNSLKDQISALNLGNVTLDDAQFTNALKQIQAFEKLKYLRLSIANAQQLTELAKKNSLKDQISTLYLNRVTLDDAQFTNALWDIEEFKKLKKLRLKVANQAQLTLLISVLDRSSNTSVFWNNIQLEINGIEQNWINFKKAEGLLENHSKLSLWLDTLNTIFFVGADSNKAITIPKGMHVGGELRLCDKPELESVTFAEGMHVGGALQMNNNPRLSSITFPEGMHVGGALQMNNNPRLSSITFPEGMHVGGSIFLRDNSKLESVTFEEGMHVGGDLILYNNHGLSSVTFEEGMHVGGTLFLLDNHGLSSVTFEEGMHVGEHLFLSKNPKLSSVTFPKGMHVGGILFLRDNSKLSSVKIGRGVTIKKADLTGCTPEVLKTFFHDLRAVEELELSRDTEIVGSGLFIALLLNKKLNKDSIVYANENKDFSYRKKSLYGNEWFTLRDKLLDTGGSKENAFANLEKSEKQMLLQVQGDLQAYLDSHHPETENADSLDNNNDKKDLNDNSAKHTQNKETTEAPPQDYNLIKQIVEGLEKLRSPGSKLTGTSPAETVSKFNNVTTFG